MLGTTGFWAKSMHWLKVILALKLDITMHMNYMNLNNLPSCCLGSSSVTCS